MGSHNNKTVQVCAFEDTRQHGIISGQGTTVQSKAGERAGRQVQGVEVKCRCGSFHIGLQGGLLGGGRAFALNSEGTCGDWVGE